MQHNLNTPMQSNLNTEDVTLSFLFLFLKTPKKIKNIKIYLQFI